MEDDLILGEEEPVEEYDRLGDIITGQLEVLATLDGFDATLYEEAQEDKIKVASRAMKIIQKAQAKLIKEV